MSERDDGGPAFPTSYPPVEPTGMTLRDYFAAKAVPVCIQKCHPNEARNGESIADMYARRAYEVADAMLRARKDSPHD